MTEEKLQFAERLKAKFLARFDAKFAKGDAEHKDDLFSTDVLQESYEEVIDLLTYLSVAIETRQSEYQRGYADGFKAAVLQESHPEHTED